MSTIRISEIIADPFRKVHGAIKRAEATHIWLPGGRGSTKSSFAAIEIVHGIHVDPEANATVLRKVKDTLKDSVREQVVWAIYKLGAETRWDIPDAKLTLTYLPTGQEIRFRGADNPRKIKSIAFRKGYNKFLWYEELDEFNGPEEIRMINQSLLRGGGESSQFFAFYTFNPPKSRASWVNQESMQDAIGKLVHRSTYLEVPKQWLGQQFIDDADDLKGKNLKAYEHEYMGSITGTGGEIFENVQIREISDAEIKTFLTVRRGLDFGFATDPVHHTTLAYDRKFKRLYIFRELHAVGLSNTGISNYMELENPLNDLVMADSAEPRTINELNQYGRRVLGVKKGPDSVDYGIKFLQDLDAIIIDEARCPNTAREFLNYELEKDTEGNWKAKFPDKNNHSIDAVRYAMNYEVLIFIKEMKEKAKRKINWDFERPKENPITGGKASDDYLNYGLGR